MLTDHKHCYGNVDPGRTAVSKEEIVIRRVDRAAAVERGLTQENRLVQVEGDIRIDQRQTCHRLLKFAGKQKARGNDQNDEHPVGDRVTEKFDTRLFEEFLELKEREKKGVRLEREAEIAVAAYFNRTLGP